MPKNQRNPFDLHLHSDLSDGVLSPEELVRLAAAEGVFTIALTDHDTTAGVARAVAEGALQGVRVLPGIEMDTEHGEELHMLGLCIDAAHPLLREYEAHNARRRILRNRRILAQLEDAGIHIQDRLVHSKGNDTRLHFAKSLMLAGYAATLSEAFDRYLTEGRPGYVHTDHILPEDAIRTIHAAGGIAVLAHPCKLKRDVESLIRRLAAAGLDGLEAYYPTSTPGQRTQFVSLACQLDLLVSCGSDFHGGMRPARIGQAYCPDPALLPMWERISRAGASPREA